MPYMTANSYFGLSPESSYGTAASIGLWTPIQTPKVATELTWLDDSAFRGSPVEHYDQVPGVIKAVFDGKCYLYSDVFPHLVRASLGGADSVGASVAVFNSAGASVVGYPHTIGLINSPNTGSQAPSYTIANNSVDYPYQLTAARMNDLAIAVSVDAAVESTFSFVGNAASIVASVSPTESTQHFVPAWNVSASIGGASVAVIETFDVNLKRNTTSIHTLGQQGPYNNFQGPISVEGKFMFVVEAGEPYYAAALTRNQQSVKVQLTDPATGYNVLLQMSNVQLEAPVIDQSKAYVTLSANYVAVANTTDAVGGGYSPIKVIATNGVSTTY
jgi:Phage tail tube protein